ncbi:MAG: RNA polymerase-associated protein RapA [Opitutus sp.]|nr:RNA polymerase-associated protein RapA [Opitutus sp.]MCS6247967.1 RNA polymerase-associated protein RapA [Opitutus sp.]MCS6275623.1 RNA polymerase-associated protein RapA [Opitutus sp.]MCS6276875.1 RNA polymerase-associated protein RapA [Opitutus sp.]MCS6301476.1 RNA polymerase-associated protein RapA [Opitutus sp.]
MSLGFVGQRCLSEREPELGLGLVAELDRTRITIEFPATREKRIYARGTPVLKRVQFTVGETVATRAGEKFTVASVDELAGLLTYVGPAGQRVREDVISDLTSVASPAERLMAAQAEPSTVFDLRLRALQARARFRQSPVRGFLGGRIDLIPHQFYILNEVAGRQIPRVLLADEVGLGKTIEACLILQRLLATGRVKRALILVPESLTHQWFVELLRRFNLWFTIFDEPRCADIEGSEPGKNPFLSSQLALGSVSLLSGMDNRRAQVVEAGWDIVIVDEAHHLGWTPEEASPEYKFVEQLARKTAGLLLLTATPTQLGQAGHFARLRLLDPHRYDDFESFVDEAADFGQVAAIAEKIVDGKTLTAADHTALRKLFDRDPETLATHLAALSAGKAGARDALLRTLLDQHGTGRVVFRNTRAAMTGFPKRQYCPVAIADATPTLLARVGRELQAEETGEIATLRFSYKEDPRLDWLVGFLQKNAPAKVLLICRSERKVLALEAAIKEKLNLNIGLFHESLPLIQRDRQAAWFAEPAGAQLLLCSEIGSEGRNFQFAHHLVLFDLPLNPGLVEQRIGRLDRIGQTETIRIHVPYLVGGADEAVAQWYHLGLNSFEAPLHGGNDYADAFRTRLLELATSYGEGKLKKKARPQLDAFIAETEVFRDALQLKLKQGRDRLLELNSFNGEVAKAVIDRVRAADADPLLKKILTDLLEHFGVEIKEHEDGDFNLNADRAYVEGFPSIPRDGILATYQRKRAIAREDIRFLSADHPLVQDTIDLLVDSPAGTTAFCVLEADKPNLLLEAVFVLETVADARWHVDQFLAPTPVRVLVDIHGGDLTDDVLYSRLNADVEDAPLASFLERPGFNGTLLKNLVTAATERATARTLTIKKTAREQAAATLTADLQRLVELGKLNDNVRPEELELAKKQVLQVRTAIEQARLRLDSLRLIVEGVDLD